VATFRQQVDEINMTNQGGSNTTDGAKQTDEKNETGDNITHHDGEEEETGHCHRPNRCLEGDLNKEEEEK
jgi:hypothetical protein